MTPNTLPTTAQQYLTDRAVSISKDKCSKRGIRWSGTTQKHGLVIPYYDADKEPVMVNGEPYERWRVAKKGFLNGITFSSNPKFMQPRDSGIHLYFDPAVSYTSKGKFKRGIVEGETRAMSIHDKCKGWRMVACGGKDSWDTPELEAFVVSDEPFYIGFDAGDGVQASINRCAHRVREYGGIPVQIIVPPLGDADNAGIDDHIAVCGGSVMDEFEVKEVEPGTTDDLIDELSTLPALSYDQQREKIAKELGCRVSTLDKLVYRRQEELDEDSTPSMEFPEDDPWPTPVNGARLLDEIASTVSRFAVVPPHADTTIALWSVFTYLYDAAYVCPMLGLMSPEKRCGKTTVLNLLSNLVNRPMPSSNISPSAVFRGIEKWQPTLIIDEADTFFKQNDELGGVLNSGHTRGTAFVIRTVGDDYEPMRFSTWGPKAYASIRTPQDTIYDRTIRIWLKRKTVDEKVERFRRHHESIFLDLRRKIVRWTQDNTEAFEQAEEEHLNEIQDRAADNWEPLLQIAKLASASWYKRAVKAAKAITNSVEDMNEDSIRIELLKDIQTVFNERNVERISSHDLVGELVAMEDRPWPEFRKGQPLTPAQLARLLRPFNVRTTTMRAKTKLGSPFRGKAYYHSAFEEVFTRYLTSLS